MSRRASVAIAFMGFFLMACCCGGIGGGPKNVPNQNVIADPAKTIPAPPPVAKGEVVPKAKADETKTELPAFLTTDKAAILGNFRIQILSGSIGKITYIDTTRRTTFLSGDDLLGIKISIANTSDTILEHYHPWSGRDFAFEKTHASIRDEFGNNYFNLRGTTFSRPRGQLEFMTRLDPGKSVEDLIVFDRPINRANEFTLEFPGGNINKRGERIVYKIPRSFFEK